MILCYKITQLFAAVLIRVIVVEVVDETKADEELPAARKLGQDQKMEAEVHHRPCMTNPQTSIFVINLLQTFTEQFSSIHVNLFL